MRNYAEFVSITVWLDMDNVTDIGHLSTQEK